MRYYLSNRQLKELANGKALQIALPDPGPEAVGDSQLAAWAAERLVSCGVDSIRAVSREAIEVFRQRQDHPIGDEIGTIRMDQTPYADRLTWWVEVVVVTLCERERPRSTYPVQWPGRFEMPEEKKR